MICLVSGRLTPSAFHRQARRTASRYRVASVRVTFPPDRAVRLHIDKLVLERLTRRQGHRVAPQRPRARVLRGRQGRGRRRAPAAQLCDRSAILIVCPGTVVARALNVTATLLTMAQLADVVLA